MKRIIALLVGVAAVFVVAARPVAAVPGAPDIATSSTTVPADAIGLTLSQVAGSGLAVTLDPGASEEHDLVVSNHTADLRLTIKITATDATGSLGSRGRVVARVRRRHDPARAPCRDDGPHDHRGTARHAARFGARARQCHGRDRGRRG